MTTVPPRPVAVIGGMDTHADIHVAAACDPLGAVQGTESFPTTPAGWRRLLAFLVSFAPVEMVGVEGTGSYGSGLARHLAESGVRLGQYSRCVVTMGRTP
jgi:transposase